ncbi:protein lin-10-like isoform X1 [Phlebotomus argentipes]|uniref:protein lin-10-like isoform X1 n=1 Tax=Phlebotomus argentipes TaxID=94469 RepID=UPI002893219F|nr:protein lin-10-like isoform X1 [Phlebotomus argentipes]
MSQDGVSSFGAGKHPVRGISNTKQTTRPELHQINNIVSERYLWEMRRRTPNTTPASTVLNSPDLTESESRHSYHHHHHQYPIKLGRSPVSHADSASPVSPSGGPALVTEGEMVVFDDIGDSWNGGRMILDSPTISDTEGAAAPRPDGTSSPGSGSRVAKVIGGLPIAEYEGSPRRFGNVQYDSPGANRGRNVLASPAMFPPRPGFPQRVVPSPSGAYGNCQEDLGQEDVKLQPPTTFDYLYEFSETRKVLEEFFKCPEDDTERAKSSSSEFIPHGYHNQMDSVQDHCYIGQRLAQKTQETQSPTRKIREEEFDHNDIELYLDSGSRSSGELADTELEHHVRRHSRNFTLSPETTDYDSNCGDLDSLSNDINGIVPDFNRLYTSMPVLEDGLSSGHASDTENNNPAIGEARQRVITGGNFLEQSSSPKRCIEGIQEHDQGQEVKSFPTPPPPQPLQDVQAALKDIRTTLQRTKTLPAASTIPTAVDRNIPKGVIEAAKETESPVWVPRHHNNATSRESLSSEHPSKAMSGEDEEADTDLETDRLLGQQRLDDQGFYEDKTGMWKGKLAKSPSGSKSPPLAQSTIRQGVGTALSPTSPVSGGSGGRISPATLADKSPTDSIGSKKDDSRKGKSRNKEALDPAVLIEGVLFRARYLGSTQLVCEGQPTKSTRMIQAEEAVSRIKAPEGENQPSTEVDLFISTEKIMVLNTDLKEIMMDHALRTISYIADIGDLVVLMARRRFVPQDVDDGPKPNRTPKMICHVFESDEAQFIAQSIGQAFQVAYMEFLKANGIEDHSFVKEMDYQEVLNSQEIFGDELEIFAKKELQKEVVVPKAKGEILGVVIVESGWGSMLPTVVIANLLSSGAAARCGQLNIGDQIIAINGLSLVGLPLSTCQTYIRNTKTQTAVKFTVVPCPPVVEVKIKRPNTKYQLGFSVQNGVICSLLRGGIAERGGVRVGHRIIEINNQSVVAVPHEKIVNLLATSVGEILMKTMPTSMFRLLTGQENPIYI